MKRIIFAAVMLLSGCATWQGNGPADIARRNAYIAEHPNDQFANEIRQGIVAVGMSMDDVTAMWGDSCHIYGDSQVGTTYTCQPDTTVDQTLNPGTMIFLDTTDHVASWSN